MDNLQQEIELMIKKGHNKVRSMRRSKDLVKSYYDTWIGRGLYVYFATFTFNDDNIQFNRKSFTDYLRRTCKINCCLFADYGLKNMRFHLHGIIACSYELDENKNYFNKFGFTKFQITNEHCINYIVKYSIKFLDNIPVKMFRCILIKNNC